MGPPLGKSINASYPYKTGGFNDSEVMERGGGKLTLPRQAN